MKAVCVIVDELPCGCFECIFKKSILQWVDVVGMKHFTHTCIILDVPLEDINILHENCNLKLDRRKCIDYENKT